MEDKTIFDSKPEKDEIEVVGCRAATDSETRSVKDSGSYVKTEPHRPETFKTKIAKAKAKFVSTYAKRNPLVNALLSLLMITMIIVAVIDLQMAVKMIFSEKTAMEWVLLPLLTFYPLFTLYYMYRFVVDNRKNAILPAFLGSVFAWYVIMFFYVLVTTPNSVFLDEEGNESSNAELFMFLYPLLLSLALVAATFVIVFVIMLLKKYGATAWTLLDKNRGSRPIFEKISFALFFIVLLIPVGIIFLSGKENGNEPDAIGETYPSHATAQIGDYYYDDGTVSSELLADKNIIGIVFSLETSETDKMMGYTHGQIVALNDADSRKIKWDGGDPKDYDRYPNYTWENRMDALEDIDGIRYKKCDDAYCLDINLACHHYSQGEGEGISDWYLPTAGQWTKILENLGNVTVDRMLRFDAETAAKNLEIIGIKPQRWYWTISEFDAENAWSIRLANGEFGSRSNKQNEAYARPVASF